MNDRHPWTKLLNTQDKRIKELEQGYRDMRELTPRLVLDRFPMAIVDAMLFGTMNRLNIKEDA